MPRPASINAAIHRMMAKATSFLIYTIRKERALDLLLQLVLLFAIQG
jgi:hypothetical protein